MIVNLGTYKLGNKIQFIDCNNNSSVRHYDKATQWNLVDTLMNFFDFIGDKNVIFRDGLLSDDLANRITGDLAWFGTREDVDSVIFDYEVGNYEVTWDIQYNEGWSVKITIENSYVESSKWIYEMIVK